MDFCADINYGMGHSSLETQDTSGVIGEMFPTKLY